ncbi:MAG TPA: D-alanyl-D-alanine carboxypeptidase/D-alanyl-D-alanine-endopeptidase [Blastocatellia bacterium]|nr:D-alanyl-D-alanine carboxypeptidase/D-alanyl-D-alanine-endopeptidase [Blastocatellia bacterium]
MARRVSCALVLALALVWLVPSVALSDNNGKLEQQIAAVIGADLYRHSSWGIAVADQATGDMLYELNSEKLFAPASTTKLFTVAAALDALGPDFKFTTSIYRTGELDERGLLHGNLILRAMGDPNLSGRTNELGHLEFTNNDHTYAAFGDTASVTDTHPLRGIDELVRQVHAAGVKELRDVLVDDRLFDHDQGSGSGPSLLTPIVVNDNVIDVIVTPDSAAGAPARMTLRPATAYAQFDMSVETVDEERGTDVVVERVAAHRYTVRGNIARGHSPLVRIAEVEDPAEFARTLLIERLQVRGIRVRDSALAPMDRQSLPVVSEYSKLPVVARLVSPPFSEALRVILKVSHNLHASLLPLIVASQKNERTLAAGLHFEGEFLRRCGIQPGSVSFGGGAGGTRADWVSPQAVISLLRAMSRRPDFRVYYDGLPILGVDGTLADAVGFDSPVRGKMHGKTGTLVNFNMVDDKMLVGSKALAGYLTTATGRKVVIALYMNNVEVGTAADLRVQGQVLGRLCEIIYGAL